MDESFEFLQSTKDRVAELINAAGSGYGLSQMEMNILRMDVGLEPIGEEIPPWEVRERMALSLWAKLG